MTKPITKIKSQAPKKPVKPEKPSRTTAGRRKNSGFGNEPINKDIVKLIQRALDANGVVGVVEFLQSMRYMYENVWTEIRSAVNARFSDDVVINVSRDGGHTYLRHDDPYEYLPNDHPAILLERTVQPFHEDCKYVHSEYPTWAICSGCGRPFQCTTTDRTIMILTSCPNLLQGTGVRLITQALKLKGID